MQDIDFNKDRLAKGDIVISALKGWWIEDIVTQVMDYQYQERHTI